MSNKVVLLTGWSGGLGRYVLAALHNTLRPDDQVFCVARQFREVDSKWEDKPTTRYYAEDLTEYSAVENLISRVNPSHVINCSGVATNGDPLELMRVNYGILNNLIQAGIGTEWTSARLLHVSSPAVFGNLLGVGDGPDECSYPEPQSMYGFSKLAGEDAIPNSGYYNIVRPVAQVGDHATHGLVRDIVAKLLAGTPTLDLLGDAPGSDKPYAYAGDTASEIVRLAFSHRHESVTHLTPTDGLNVAEVAEIVMDELRIRKPIRFLGEAANFPGDNRRVRLRSIHWATDGPMRPSAEAVRLGVRDIRASLIQSGVLQ